MDRWGSRWKPQCDCWDFGLCTQTSSGYDLAPLLNGGALLRNGAIPIRFIGWLSKVHARVGRTLTWHQRTPYGRTLSSRTHRNLLPPRRHTEDFDGWRCGTPCSATTKSLHKRSWVFRRPQNHWAFSSFPFSTGSCQSTLTTTNSLGGGIWISFSDRWFAPKFW